MSINDMTGEAMKLWNLGLTDKRTHNKLVIRVQASSKMAADRIFVCAGLNKEYDLRYIREDPTCPTEPRDWRIIPMEFDRLDAILNERGISRRALALAVGINAHTMATAFKRGAGLSAKEVFKIAEYLNVKASYLMGYDDYNDPAVTYAVAVPTKRDIKTALSNIDIPEGVSESQFFAVMANIYSTLAKVYEELPS